MPPLCERPSPKRSRRLRCWLALWCGAVGFALTGVAGTGTAEKGEPSRAGGTVAPAAAGRRITFLRTEIARHNALYFQRAAPEITDYEYDQLKRELADLERAFPEEARRAPAAAAEMGDDRSGLFPSYRHRERMLSLDKAYTEAEVREFYARTVRRLGRVENDFVIEPKFDGLAVSVTYEQGRLRRAVTRGDGTEGDDITANVLALRGLPQTLRPAGPEGEANPIPDLVELRGELYVPFEEFQRVNREREAEGLPAFAHPRNLAAGTVKQLDPRDVAARGIAVVFYGLGACEPAAAEPRSQRGLAAQLRAWGLPTVEQQWSARTADEIWAAIRSVGEARRAFPFPTDGAVVKLDAVAGQRELGATATAPRWAVAYKFAPERVATRLRAITIQVGRTGVLTPVGELAPVALAGSTVARATLHNRDEIARRDLRVGDMVWVEKAGEIIPAITGVDLARRPPEARPFVFPSVCPACGTAVVQAAGEVAVRCPNAACPAQLRRRLEHFASKAAVGIDGLGPAMIERLVERGRVRDIADLYRLRREDLATAGGQPGKAADNLIAAIERSKRAELWRFVHGLGLPQVGEATAKELARRFGRLEALAAATDAEFVVDGRSAIPGVGDTAARALGAHFRVPANRAVLTDLIAAGVNPIAPAMAAKSGRLAEKTFVLTGTLPTLSRPQAVARIEAAGGRVRSGVSAQTHFVVAGADAGAKLDHARKLGVRIITEAELLEMLGAE
jgi:DNA ligase (NAD+)